MSTKAEKREPVNCDHKHTVYQPSEKEWKCPDCGTPPPDGWCIDDGPAIMESCEKVHVDDYLRCAKCDYELTGEEWAKKLARGKSLVTCTHCKGTGLVKAARRSPR